MGRHLTNQVGMGSLDDRVCFDSHPPYEMIILISVRASAAGSSSTETRSLLTFDTVTASGVIPPFPGFFIRASS